MQRDEQVLDAQAQGAGRVLSENTGPHRAAGRQADPHRTAGQMANGVVGSNVAIAETLGIDKVDVCAGTRHSIERGLEPVMDRLRGARHPEGAVMVSGLRPRVRVAPHGWSPHH